MSLTKSSAADMKAANVVGEGEGLSTFNVADPKGTWFQSVAQFPLIDPETGTRFEAGVPTRATMSAWVQLQIDNHAMAECDAPEDAKGKAAATVTPGVDETSKTDSSAPGSMGNGMQSGVTGS